MSAPTSPPAAFTGLFPRLAALLIDFVIIYFAAYTFDLALRRPLMELGPLLPLLSTFGAFAYFWLGNGPVGGGTTFGKAVINIRVVTAADRPAIPDYAAAFRRALLQFPLVYLALFQFGAEVLDLSPFAAAVGDGLVRLVVIALLFTHAYCIVTHPQKAAWHDLWAGVRVTRDPVPREFPDALAAAQFGDLVGRMRAHRYFSRYFFVAMCAVLSLGLVALVRDPGRRTNLRLIGRIAAETPVAGYRLQSIDVRNIRDFDPWLDFALQDFVPMQPDDATTSPSLATASVDASTTPGGPERVLFLRYIKTKGSVDPADLDESLARQIDALRLAAPDYLAAAAPFDAPLAPPPTRFVAFLTERFKFVIFSPGKGRVAVFDGPLDPAEGPLNDAWYEPAP